MFLELPPSLGEPVKPHTNKRYRFAPFLSVVHAGSIDLSDIDPMPLHRALEIVRWGKLPKGGGFVEFPDGSLGAIDAVAAEISNNVLRLLPELKSVVAKDGSITRDSVVTLQKDDGRATLMAANLNPTEDPWLMAGPEHEPSPVPPAQLRVLKHLPGSLLGEFEFRDEANGMVIATQRRRYY